MSDDDLLILLILAGAAYYYYYYHYRVDSGGSTTPSPVTTTPTPTQQQLSSSPSPSNAEVKRQEAERIDVRRKLADRPVQKHEILRVAADRVARFIHIVDKDHYGDDILHLPQYAKARGDAGKILEMKRICTARWDCKAFNTEGFIKRGRNGTLVEAKPQAGIDIYLRI